MRPVISLSIVSQQFEIHEGRDFPIFLWNETRDLKTTKGMTDLNISQQDFKYLKEHLTARMIQILAEEQGYSLEEAFERIYTSPIYGKLSDARTGLFYQSPRYVLSYI